MQHFELITETEVNEAQTDLADEVTPQITELLKRAEQSLSKLERKQFALKSKVCLHVWNHTKYRRTCKPCDYHRNRQNRSKLDL